MKPQVRLLTVTIALLALSLAVDYLAPAYANVVFYALLIWLVVSFFVYRTPARGRAPFPRSAPGPGPTGPSAPLPSSAPVTLGFCAFCGAGLPDGAPRCPACHHEVRPI